MGISVNSFNYQPQVIYRYQREFDEYDKKSQFPQNVLGGIVNPDSTLTYIK